MTNREILNAPKETLSSLERQRQFLLRVNLTAMPCPACHTPLDALTAADVDVDDYDFGVTQLDYHCPSCHAELEHVVPFFAVGPGWFWKLKDSWLQEQLQKAKAYDGLKVDKEGKSQDA